MNITTTYAWTGSGYVVPSAASKGGVLALTRSIAAEWLNILDVMQLLLTFSNKRSMESINLPGFSKFIDLKRESSKRVGEHPELANLAAYLLSIFQLTLLEKL